MLKPLSAAVEPSRFDPFASGEADEIAPEASAGGAPVPSFDPFATGQAAPIDPLDDFEVYNALEDEKEARGYDPADPGVAAKVWAGVTDLVKSLGRGAMGASLAYGQARMGNAAPAVALTTQTAGEVLANSKLLGEGAKTATAKAVNAATAAVEPSLAPEMKRLSREASWNFQREARAVDEFTGKFNQHMETFFPQALAGLASVPVDREAAQGLSMVADPANFVPAAQAARWTLRAPLRGAVRAAQSALKEATLEVAQAGARRESALLLLKPGLNPAERGPLFARAAESLKAMDAAKARQVQASRALKSVAEQQRAIVDQLATSAAGQPLVTRGAALAARGAGTGAEAAGAGMQRLAALPDQAAALVAGGADEAARRGIADGVRNATGLFGLVPAAAGVSGAALRNIGRNMKVYGRVLAEAEGQLPFFKRLARETDGLSSWGASLVDQSGAGQMVSPVFRAAADASRAVPFALGVGYVGGGGETDAALRGAGGGLVFGLAGGAYGQWQRYGSGALFRQRQLADVNRYRQTLPTEEARMHFNQMPAADQASLATMQLAHPDLKIKHERLGPGRPSFYYAAEDGPVAVINLDTKDGVNAVVAHEIGHHVEKHGLAPVVERVLFGDPVLEQPGLYTRRGPDGAPLKGTDGRYELDDTWAGLKAAYNDRIRATASRTGEALPARSDGDVAREVFAEHVADYLVGGGGALRRDLAANIWTRALDGLADSSLVGSLPMLRQVLGKAGVPLGAGQQVLGSRLFPGGLPASHQLHKLIGEYHRQSARRRQPALQDERGDVRYTYAEVVQHPQIIDTLFDGSDDVVRDRHGRAVREKDGSPRFAAPKEQAAQRADLAKEISGWMEQNQPRAGVDPAQTRPAEARWEKTVDEKGRVTEGWLTPSLPGPLLRQLEASGKYNPAQLRHLRAVSDAIAQGKGQSALFFYQPAMGRGGKYKSLAGDWRTETPYALFISKAGNVLFRTVSREKLVANAQDLIKSGRGSLWGNEVGRLMADVDAYLANHAAGRPGADGIGTDKRDQINALFGINTKANVAANPFLESSPKSPIVIRARRLDRTNRLTPVEEYFPTTYEKLNRNLRPEN